MSPTFIGTNTGAKTTTNYTSDAQYPPYIITVIFSDNSSSAQQLYELNTAFRIFSFSLIAGKGGGGKSPP